MVKKTIRWMLKNEWIWIVIFAAMYLRVPTLMEPYWYGDEGIYLTIGQVIRDGGVLYRDIHDNKPPGIYYLAALVDGDLFWYRFLAAVVNVTAVGVFAVFAKQVFSNHKPAAVVAAWLFLLLTNSVYWEGNIANAENIFLLTSVGGAYLIYKEREGKNPIKILFGGLVIGIGGLFKVPALADVGVWLFVWFCLREREWIKKSVFFAAGAALPIIVTGLIFAAMGVGREYLAAAGLQNAGYVQAWGPGTGLYSLTNRALVLVLALAVVWGLTRKLGKTTLLALVWFCFGLFAALISARPYPHYLLQLSPAIALTAGLMIVGGKVNRIVGVIVVLVLYGTYVVFNFWIYSWPGYVENFALRAIGRRSVDDYFAWFSPTIKDVYKISAEIKKNTNKEDKIFVWAEEPMIYALSDRIPVGKYTTRYHVYDFKAEKSVGDLVTNERPKMVVTRGEEDKLPGLVNMLESDYLFSGNFGDFKLYRLSINDRFSGY